jgi:hypothetical protein
LVTSYLVVNQIEAGEALLRELDKRKFRIESAFWLFISESSDWRLFLATALVDDSGPRSVYTRLQKVLVATRIDIPLTDISVVSPSHEFVRLLQRVVSVSGVSGIRFSRTSVDGVFFEDAYIYRTREK